MYKISVLVLLAVLSTTWALDCYTCTDCKNQKSRTEQETCEEGEKCAYFTISYMSRVTDQLVHKGCYREDLTCEEAREIFKTGMEAELAEKGEFRELDDIRVACEFCDGDRCNHRG